MLTDIMSIDLETCTVYLKQGEQYYRVYYGEVITRLNNEDPVRPKDIGFQVLDGEKWIDAPRELARGLVSGLIQRNMAEKLRHITGDCPFADLTSDAITRVIEGLLHYHEHTGATISRIDADRLDVAIDLFRPVRIYVVSDPKIVKQIDGMLDTVTPTTQVH